jgi:hypothetical protein
MSAGAQHAEPSGRPARRSARPVAVLLCLGLAACAHYQLGTNTKLTFATVYVAPVEDRAMLPQAQAIVATALRDALLRDGRVAVVATPAEADVTLRVALVGYNREMAAANPADTGLARKFALHLHATCTLTDNRTTRPLFTDRDIAVTKDAYTDSGQLQAEFQTVPLLAEALADQVAHAVLDVW